MVAKEFIDLTAKFRVTNYYGLEDSADKMSFIGSVLVFLLSGMIVTMKTYIFKPISCYAPIVPAGANFDSYLRSFCWVDGTVPILHNETLPGSDNEWKDAYDDLKIGYYQWIPFILGIQCLLFYIPRLLWQTICYNKLGIDLENVFTQARKAADADGAGRKKNATDISKILNKALYFHRDYRCNKWANYRKRLFKITSFFMMSRRMGSWLIGGYLFVKFLYLANAIGQLFLMHQFLQIKGLNVINAAFSMINSLVNGKTWQDTRIFPRSGACLIKNILLTGSSNDYLAHCSLPLNMLNEKIYMFLWVWVIVVMFVTSFSIVLWTIRMVMSKTRANLIKKMLKNKNIYKKEERMRLNQFISDFLRHDGVFIIKMMSINCGDMVTSDVVECLWDLYNTDYQDSETSSMKDHHHSIYPHMTYDGSDTSDKKAVFL